MHGGIVTSSQCIDWAFSQRLIIEGTKRGDSFNFASATACWRDANIALDPFTGRELG